MPDPPAGLKRNCCNARLGLVLGVACVVRSITYQIALIVPLPKAAVDHPIRHCGKVIRKQRVQILIGRCPNVVPKDVRSIAINQFPPMGNRGRRCSFHSGERSQTRPSGCGFWSVARTNQDLPSSTHQSEALVFAPHQPAPRLGPECCSTWVRTDCRPHLATGNTHRDASLSGPRSVRQRPQTDRPSRLATTAATADRTLLRTTSTVDCPRLPNDAWPLDFREIASCSRTTRHRSNSQTSAPSQDARHQQTTLTTAPNLGLSTDPNAQICRTSHPETRRASFVQPTANRTHPIGRLNQTRSRASPRNVGKTSLEN